MTRRKKYFRRQKLMGLGLIALCVLIILFSKDATFAVIGIPLGIYLIFTKEMVLDDDYKFEMEKKQKAQ